MLIPFSVVEIFALIVICRNLSPEATLSAIAAALNSSNSFLVATSKSDGVGGVKRKVSVLSGSQRSSFRLL